jgi:hypothetical protein
MEHPNYLAHMDYLERLDYLEPLESLKHVGLLEVYELPWNIGTIWSIGVHGNSTVYIFIVSVLKVLEVLLYNVDKIYFLVVFIPPLLCQKRWKHGTEHSTNV